MEASSGSELSDDDNFTFGVDTRGFEPKSSNTHFLKKKKKQVKIKKEKTLKKDPLGPGQSSKTKASQKRTAGQVKKKKKRKIMNGF